ncbi:hypothetical protein K432DRAFT_161307 [Lepidopterella palustris CBS 459.81]|uniref:DUF7580 domain-containing protein n=1 Tax=Lepidopterella palustris CBS 459.81 TaxID=1314670 RepID=A0A8E2JAV9_9PEZI|nr:hypothetical protein K432DRAFT_161307 [Lepidopterella palustris CBS 459.81]
MSGAEVTGLILAVMPLFISALEDYNDGLDPIKAFCRWERELPQFIRKLRNQHVHYEQTLRLLLAPITTEFELAEMITKPDGPLWKNETMTEKLKEKLEESYQAYQGTITDIERIMKKIASKLDLDRASDVTRNELEAMLVANPQQANHKFEFKKRVKFGMSKRTIKKLLEELDDCNKELERFTERSEKLEPYRRATKPSLAKRLQRIQSYAKSLHQVLVQSWSCSCRSSHCTNLQLEQRITGYSSGFMKTRGEADGGTCFTVSFSSTCSPWTWQEAEILMQENDNDDFGKLTNKPKITKGVSFSGLSMPPPPYSEVAQPTTITTTKTLQEINDICFAIQQFHTAVPCIGFSLDIKGKLRGAYPVKPRNENRSAGGELVTLEELFTHPPLVNGRPAKLTKKERYSLAVTLASSTLQLNSTPWFSDHWSKKDIAFHRISNGPRPIDIEHPYVTQRLIAAQNGISNCVETGRTFHNKNTILLALAVTLLELYFGISAEKYQEAELSTSTGMSNPWTICAMAYEWAENEKENLSAAFLAAITHCLRCFGDPGSSLKDPEFLQAAVESIVMPLQDELCQFLGKTAP